MGWGDIVQRDAELSLLLNVRNEGSRFMICALMVNIGSGDSLLHDVRRRHQRRGQGSSVDLMHGATSGHGDTSPNLLVDVRRRQRGG